MKRLLLGLLSLLFIGVPVALVAAVVLCFQDEPLVRRTVAFTPGDVERAMRLFEKHDPRRMKSGMLRTMTIRGEDLDLAVNYLATDTAREARALCCNRDCSPCPRASKCRRVPWGDI